MNGVIIVDKSKGYTSFDVVAIMRKLCGTKKVGHTGTLDPLATGVLPILVGNATKIQQLLQCDSKEYVAELKFGLTSDTLDITGNVHSIDGARVTYDQLSNILKKFRGTIQQRPPMYSAVQVKGVRLYNLARMGIDIERTARSVTVHKLELMDFNFEEQKAHIVVSCSKGTYIRSLCDDIGRELGSGAVLCELRRTVSGQFCIDNSVDLATLKACGGSAEIHKFLLRTDDVLPQYRKLNVTEVQAIRFKNGAGLATNRLGTQVNEYGDGEIFRVYSSEGIFLGLGMIHTASAELLPYKQCADTQDLRNQACTQ